MEEFIARENIRRFTEQLANCTNAQQRQVLERLLLEEQEKLSALQNQPSADHLAG